MNVSWKTLPVDILNGMPQVGRSAQRRSQRNKNAQPSETGRTGQSGKHKEKRHR